MAAPFRPAFSAPGQPYSPGTDPGAQSAEDQRQLAMQSESQRIANIGTAQAGQNENANRIASMPAYGTAAGQMNSNEINASQQARMASLQALLKVVGF
jgi:hypothetical protein